MGQKKDVVGRYEAGWSEFPHFTFKLGDPVTRPTLLQQQQQAAACGPSYSDSPSTRFSFGP